MDAQSTAVRPDDGHNPSILPGTTLSIEFVVSHSKQTTGLRSTRYKIASAEPRRSGFIAKAGQILIDTRAIRNAPIPLKIKERTHL
jgi:hypothetical protein